LKELWLILFLPLHALVECSFQIDGKEVHMLIQGEVDAQYGKSY
jgi:hypothetical protein